jgi:hypothetical protein
VLFIPKSVNNRSDALPPIAAPPIAAPPLEPLEIAERGRMSTPSRPGQDILPPTDGSTQQAANRARAHAIFFSRSLVFGSMFEYSDEPAIRQLDGVSILLPFLNRWDSLVF